MLMTWTSMFEKRRIPRGSGHNDRWDRFCSSFVRRLHFPLSRPPDLGAVEKCKIVTFILFSSLLWISPVFCCFFTWVRNSKVWVGTREPRLNSADSTGSWCWNVTFIIVEKIEMVMYNDVEIFIQFSLRLDKRK